MVEKHGLLAAVLVGAVRFTFGWLDRPWRHLGQGTREVMVFRLRADRIVGFVKDDSRDVLETFRVAEALSNDLAAVAAITP